MTSDDDAGIHIRRQGPFEIDCTLHGEPVPFLGAGCDCPRDVLDNRRRWVAAEARLALIDAAAADSPNVKLWRERYNACAHAVHEAREAAFEAREAAARDRRVDDIQDQALAELSAKIIEYRDGLRALIALSTDLLKDDQ